MVDFYTPDGNPVAQSRGVSSQIRTALTAIAAGFAKVAGYTGNGGKLVRINSGATAQEAMALGTANQVVGMNSGATGYEHKTVTGTANEITVTHGANSITASIPSAVTFTGKTITGGTFSSPTINTPAISGGSFTGGTDIAVADGGTGASTAADARTNLGVAIGTDVQAYDADLDAVAGLSSTGLMARTGAGTAAARTLTAPAAGITVSNGDGVSGNPTLALADDLAALEAMSGTGVAVRTASNTWTNRTITAGGGCSVTNGDGVSGNPIITLTPGVGLGDVLGPGVAVDGEIALYNGITGQTIKRASITGLLKAESGVLGSAVSGTDIKTVGGVSIIGSGDIGIIPSGYGGTGNGFIKFSGPTTSEKTFTLPDASATLNYAGKNTCWIPAGAMVSRTTNGAAAGIVETTTNKVMFKTLDFDTATQEYAQFSIQMPKSWNEGTVTFIPVWSHAATTTSFGVVWQLAGVALSNDDAGDTAFGTAITSTDTGGTTNDIYMGPESAAITIAGTPAAQDWVVFQFSRLVSDGGDTMAIDARLHGIQLLYTTDAATDA